MVTVLADDITGAAEIAGACLRWGLDTAFDLDFNIRRLPSADVWIIASDTRSLPEQEACRAVRTMALRLKELQVETLFKKIDSALRGHILAEIQALREYFPADRIFVLPANPAGGRVICKGHYCIDGTPLHQTGFARDPDFPIRTSAVREILQLTDADAEYLTPDLTHPGDYHNYRPLPGTLPAGGGAFFEACLSFYFPEGNPLNSAGKEPSPLSAGILMVCGSAHNSSRQFIRADRYFPKMEIPRPEVENYLDTDTLEGLADRAASVFNSRGKLLLAAAPGAPAKLLLAKITQALLHRCAIQELLIEGGATAYACLQTLGFPPLVPVEEYARGVVRLKVGKGNHLHLTLKPGSYQWPEKLFEIMKKTFLFIACSLLLVSCGHKPESQPGDCPAVIEIIGSDSLLSLEALQALVPAGGPEINAYRWENHWALYGVFPHPEEIQKQIEQACPQAAIRWYNRPFYVFDRRQCDGGQAQRWKHILMTANLSADTVLQQEYMDYHARQSELFPEVAQGFCRAGFQQLLVFRNGRQLMLAISIPEGESLEHLNPKTTEHNPRADEWNRIMAKYQEGVEGAPPGETWVAFDPVFENVASGEVPAGIPNPIDSIAVHSKRTADNTVPTKLSQTDTDDWTLMLLSLIAAATGIFSVILAWKTVRNTQKTVHAVQKETEQMQIKKEFQAKLFVDLIRHLYRNKVCLCATLWKLKQHGFGKKYPSEEHLLKLKILPEDLRLDRFDNTPTHYDVLHELELKFRNFNYEVDVTLEHLKIKKLKEEQKIRDLSVLEFKQQLLSIDIVNVMRKLGLFAVAIELDRQQNPQQDSNPAKINLIQGKPYKWESESEKNELLDFLNAVIRKIIDTHKRYEINNPTNNPAIQGIERQARDEEKGLPDRRYYDDVLGLTQALDDDIRGEIPKIYLIEFPASPGRKKSVDK